MRPYAIPAALWLVSALGLGLMLVGEGAWDAVGLACLAGPVVAIARALRRSSLR